MKKRYIVGSFLIELLGCLLVAVSIFNFAAAAEFPMTGFSGIAMILYRLFRIPLGFSNLVLNIPMALFCFRLLGRTFFLRSLYCMVVSSLMMDYVAPLFPVFIGERMLAAICTGVLGGIGYALIYMQGSSTGGADFAIMAVKAKKPHVALGNITFLCAVIVIFVSWLFFGDIEGVIYGLIINYLSGFVINKTMYGLNAGKIAMVVTDQGRRVSEAIEDSCHRGSTIVDAEGGYQGTARQMIFCACSNKQMYLLEKAVKQVDPASFMVIWDSNEVLGNGFRVWTPGQREE